MVKIENYQLKYLFNAKLGVFLRRNAGGIIFLRYKIV